MAGNEGNHLMLFPGLMHRQGSSASAGPGHAFSLPGFPPQMYLPLPGVVHPPTPGAYAYARPGGAYAYAHAQTYAYPPPAGTYAYPPQGYPQPGAYHPGSSAPNLQGHGRISSSSSHGGGWHIAETAKPVPKAGGGGMEKEPAPKAGGGATSAAATAYGAINNLFRGHGRSTGSFGLFGSCCGQQGSTFKHAGSGHEQGQFKQHGRRPGKVEHVHGKFCAKCTTWK